MAFCKISFFFFYPFKYLLSASERLFEAFSLPENRNCVKVFRIRRQQTRHEANGQSRSSTLYPKCTKGPFFQRPPQCWSLFGNTLTVLSYFKQKPPLSPPPDHYHPPWFHKFSPSFHMRLLRFLLPKNLVDPKKSRPHSCKSVIVSFWKFGCFFSSACSAGRRAKNCSYNQGRAGESLDQI